MLFLSISFQPPAFCICQKKQQQQQKSSLDLLQSKLISVFAICPKGSKICIFYNRSFTSPTSFFGCTGWFVFGLDDPPPPPPPPPQPNLKRTHINNNWLHDLPFLQSLTEPCRKKTYLWGFRPGQTQTALYSHIKWLEAGNFGLLSHRTADLRLSFRICKKQIFS